MFPSTNRAVVSMCCTQGAGFVLDPAGREDSAEHAVSASLATRIAHHTAEWLLDHGIRNTGFCVRATLPLGNGGTSQDQIAVEADLKAIALDDEACQDLASYVEPRARLLKLPPCPIRWSWRKT